LVSLPCRIFKSDATFIPLRNRKINVEPEWKVKALRGVQLALDYTGYGGWGGALRIDSNIAVGWGLGSSTSDVTAAIRAVADGLERRLLPEEIAYLAVQAETASDSIMFNDLAILFAHREGKVVEDLGGRLPELDVLGFNTDRSGAGIDTLTFPPARYSWQEIEAFRPLIGLLRRAIQTQNTKLVGYVASASAEINQPYLPKPHFDRLKGIADLVGALGFQVAHSGTTFGLLFDPRCERTETSVRQAQGILTEMGFGPTWRFQTGGVR